MFREQLANKKTLLASAVRLSFTLNFVMKLYLIVWDALAHLIKLHWILLHLVLLTWTILLFFVHHTPKSKSERGRRLKKNIPGSQDAVSLIPPERPKQSEGRMFRNFHIGLLENKISCVCHCYLLLNYWS